MPKPACVPCQRFFRPKRNSINVLEGKPIGRNVPPGLSAASNWNPYKVWNADLWVCEGCGAEIIVGYGAAPIAQDYLPGFEEAVSSCTHKINDC